MLTNPKRFSSVQERSKLFGALLLFFIVLSCCTYFLYRQFSQFTAEKGVLRQTQSTLKNLSYLEGSLSQIESRFRAVLLTGDQEWVDSLRNERIAFSERLRQLKTNPALAPGMVNIERSMAQKKAMQDSVLVGFLGANQAKTRTTGPISQRQIHRLLLNSNEIKKVIHEIILVQTQLLKKHQILQDNLQPRIIRMFALVTILVVTLMVFIFVLAFRNMVRRTKTYEQVQVLLSSTHDAFYFISTTWNIVLMNNKAKRFLDATSGGDARIGQNILELFPPEARTTAEQMYHDALAGKVITWKQPLELDGVPIIIELQHKAVRDSEKGAAIGISIVARDITEQEQAEAARVKSEHTRRLIMNASQDAIICIDRQGNISYWNDKAEKTFGWTEAEALGQTLSNTIIPSYHKKGHAEGFARYNTTGEHRVMNRLLELTAVNKEGKHFPVEMFMMELKGEQQEFICAFIRDISERKKAEDERNILLERLRFTNDMVQLGTWQFLAATETLTCDEVVYALLELDPSFVLDRFNWLEYIHPQDREQVSRKLMAFIENGLELELYSRIITPAGHTKFLYQKAIKNIDSQGRTIEVIGGVIDITRLKKAEATFRQVVNASPNALLLVNSKGQFVLTNQQSEKLFGYTEGELISNSFELLMPGHFSKGQASLQPGSIDAFLKERFGNKCNLVAQHKGGQEIPIEIGLSTLELEGEQMVLASVVDISQRKADEAERRELLTRFQLAADATQLGIWDFDLETGSLLWNDNMYDLTDVPRGTAMTFEKWRSLIHHDDVELTIRSFQQAVENALPNFSMEYRIQLQNGQVKTLTQRAITFCNREGVVTRCLGTSLDVTMQRQSEAIRDELLTRFELAAETLHLGILDADLRSGSVQGDTQLKLMLGIEAIPNPDWRVWIRQVHPNDRQHMQMLLLQALPQGSLLETEWRQIRENGELRHFETKARIIWKNGQPSRLIAATSDITDRVNQRNELIAAKLRAEKSEQLQEQFLANMSHEIRTPLNGIVGMSDLMGGTMLTQRQREYLQVIQNSSQGLLTIINDVLDISKIKAGKFSIENAPFNLHHVIISAFELLQLKATQKNLSYQLQVDTEVPVMVKGDAGRLSQVLINLLGNAVKFTREGSVLFTIHPAGRTNNQIRLLFTVTDTGIGMTTEAKDQIFNSFTQASREVGVEFGGTGLGLAISKQLVALQGGSIEVESTLGLGSSFRVLLNYEVVHHTSVVQDEGLKSAPNDLYKGKRVLVAEDNEVNRMVIAEYLQKVGLMATLVHDGKQAIDMLIAQPDFDLVILDLRMPIMNGFDTARLIREELDLHIPIMALSASTLRSEKENCMAVGMNAYLAKPFKSNELYDTIYWLLSGDNPLERNEEKTAEAVPEQSLCDLTELQLLGEPDFARQIIDAFVQSGANTLLEMETALAVPNTTAVFELAHRLKSSSGMLGAGSLFSLLAKIEALARTHPSDTDELGDLVANAKDLFGRVTIALQQAKETIDQWEVSEG